MAMVTGEKLGIQKQQNSECQCRDGMRAATRREGLGLYALLADPPGQQVIHCVKQDVARRRENNA